MFTVNAVVPLFVIMAFGYLIRQKGWLPEGFMTVFNRFCFDFALPCSLFKTAYNSNIRENFNPTLFGALFGLIALELMLCWLVFPRLVKDRPKLGSMIQGVFRTNAIIFGIALGRNLFGEANMLPVTLLVAASVPTFNLIAVFVLSIYGEHGGEKVTAAGLAKQIATNRLILGTLLGLGFSIIGVRLPDVVMTPVSDMAAAAGPLAMIALGAQFNFSNARKNLYPNAIAIISRLVIMPLIAVPVAVMLGFRGPELGALYVIFASPTATSSFIMAKNMGCDGDLAGEIVVFTTFFSVITVFAGVYILRTIALI